jgi:hypothetical protein
VTGNLLKNLKYQMFMHVVTDHAVRAKGASELMEEYMDASNFGVCQKLSDFLVLVLAMTTNDSQHT